MEQTSNNTSLLFEEADVIFCYTRADAIADGVLVDVTAMAREAGFRVPVAVTATLWHDYIEVGDETADPGQSTDGRLWDVLTIAAATARGSGRGSDRVEFPVLFRVNGRRKKVWLIMALSAEAPDGGPAITIMLPEDD